MDLDIVNNIICFLILYIEQMVDIILLLINILED